MKKKMNTLDHLEKAKSYKNPKLRHKYMMKYFGTDVFQPVSLENTIKMIVKVINYEKEN